MTKVWKGNKAHETIENLRRLNTELMGKLAEAKKENLSLKEDYTQLVETSNKQLDESATENRLLKESINSKDHMIHSLSVQKEKLAGELHQLKRVHEEFRDSSLSMERKMMYRLCDAEEKCGNVLLQCTLMMRECQKKNESLQLAVEKLGRDKIKDDERMKIKMGRLHDYIRSLEQDVKTSQEQKEEECQRLNQGNLALKRLITENRGGDEKAKKDLGEARRAIEFLFPRWKESTEENGKLRGQVCSLESQLTQLREEHQIAKSAFERQKEMRALEMEVLKDQNESLRDSYSALHQDMTKRMASLKYQFEILKSEERKRRPALY